MGIALLAALGSGALHALSGPDHLLSLAPLSVGRRQGAWRVGLLWGLGHGFGTLAAAAVLMLTLSMVHLEGIDRWAERIAGLALLVMGAWGVRSRAMAESPQVAVKSVLAVGLVHGVTGAAALLLLLPAVVSGSTAYRALYLSGFAVGSTLAMAALTSVIAACSRARKVPAAFGTYVPKAASALSIVLGGVWVIGSI
ncbi:HupE/UreJ family protein [Hyalangium versicolor]|uniref:HupE/UreJ family protein n=1 Tax=Hyalangium versicolor TaxID=2861190 RepID=UPI001CCAC7AA|nr:HupE/UreJ family protein [Hyalangium versicolor]